MIKLTLNFDTEKYNQDYITTCRRLICSLRDVTLVYDSNDVMIITCPQIILSLLDEMQSYDELAAVTIQTTKQSV